MSEASELKWRKSSASHAGNNVQRVTAEQAVKAHAPRT